MSSPDGYDMFFNRDERPNRPARGPAHGRSRGVSYLAPYDVEAGGTWIAVNEFGVTVSMTNQYPEPEPSPPADPVSRGLLLASLVDAPSLATVEGRVHHLDLPRYHPFAIAAFEPTAPPLILRWTGSSLTAERSPDDGFVLTSSGAIPPGLETSRRAVFEQSIRQHGPSSSTLAAVHRSHLPDRGVLSVCMHRDVAGTVSYCHISVAGPRDGITFRYAEGPPCTTPVQRPLPLPRIERLARS